MAVTKTLRYSFTELIPHWSMCFSVLKPHLVFDAFYQLILKFFSVVKSRILGLPKQNSMKATTPAATAGSMESWPMSYCRRCDGLTG